MVALGSAAAWCAPALAPRVPPLARALGLPRRVDSAGAVAVTFDDGPHPQGTPAVLEVLRAHGVTATFFLVGEQVRRTGGLRDEIVAAGHTIAIHGDRHRSLLRLGPQALAVHRAPYGVYTAVALAEVRRRSWQPMLWSRWGRDWRARATPSGVAAEVTRNLVGGDVLLLHDADDYSAPGSWRTTVTALPRILEAIDAAGLSPEPLR